MPKSQPGQKKLPGTTEETTLEAEMDQFIAANDKIEGLKTIRARHEKNIDKRMVEDGTELHNYQGYTFDRSPTSKLKVTKDKKAAKKAKDAKGKKDQAADAVPGAAAS